MNFKNKKLIINIKWKSFLSVLSVLAFCRLSEARFFTVGVNSNTTQSLLTNTTDTSKSGKAGMGGGFLIQLSKLKFFDLEAGLFLTQRNFDYVSGVSEFDISMNFMQIPFGLRRALGRFFSLGLGGYYEMGSGTISATDRVTALKTQYQYDEWIFAKSGYGAYFSLAARIPIKATALIIEFRSLIGMTDYSLIQPASWKFNDSMIFIGMQFGK